MTQLIAASIGLKISYLPIFYVNYLILDINDFLENVKAGEESKKLHFLRNALNARNNVVSENIKDIVFEHYKHFIETSKEISSKFLLIFNLKKQIWKERSINYLHY